MNKEKSVARFFFKQSCIFLSTESRALTGCAIPCSKLNVFGNWRRTRARGAHDLQWVIWINHVLPFYQCS